MIYLKTSSKTYVVSGLTFKLRSIWFNIYVLFYCTSLIFILGSKSKKFRLRKSLNPLDQDGRFLKFLPNLNVVWLYTTGYCSSHSWPLANKLCDLQQLISSFFKLSYTSIHFKESSLNMKYSYDDICDILLLYLYFVRGLKILSYTNASEETIN